MQNYIFLMKLKVICKSILNICVFLSFDNIYDKIMSIFAKFLQRLMLRREQQITV